MGKRPIESYVGALAVILYQSSLNLSKISKQLQVSRCCVCNAVTDIDDLVNRKVFLIAMYVNSKGWSRMIIE